MMLKKYIKKPHVISRMQSSNTGNILGNYATYLDKNGYSINSIQPYLRSVEHFIRWLASDVQLNKQSVENFLKEHLPNCKCQGFGIRDIKTLRAALHQLLRMLKKFDSCVNIQTYTEIDTSINEFDNYLQDICGLTESTCCYRRRYIREFLFAVFNSKPLTYNDLTPLKLVDYVNKRIQSLNKGSIGGLICSLRSYFKFLKFNGKCNDSLINALPRLRNWKLSTIPNYFQKAEVDKLLTAFNHTTNTGKRDYAMLRCLLDLGLRCCEVAKLQLEDINWRKNTLCIAKSKIHRAGLLPLSKTLAKALIDYLKNGRPQTKSRFIFVPHRAPLEKLITAATVRGVIRRAYARAGFNPQLTGTHILRKTLATRMLQNGSTLKDIADILRHRSIDTTMIYTKVDLPHLSQVTLPWPRRI